ncbi:helix-turn-helix transcriptional regulator [Micromonospora parathelypteridis]|uniref:Transcriptional regulator with XRE-family HTH domain n=1 Tax=Micromonospora parathelypteridis TaxID=1839617 RepID=A0A840WBN2_9ACTN|nr:helix-turn-helix transcriptional regulator [Micromonospora parathelypteridis]MBB5480401.1 transcriptional regulator with XRE-family HTH domain [Micromonospora parathelypteridis]GGO23572.1 transcriptional regulator [Micromonospora parathelypteridis]
MMDGELGAFLRSRREARRPAEVGLAEGPRRRTPGLRRAELATLAQVSVEYLTRLEQSRDTRPSPEILAALADALRLDSADREHLRQLASAQHARQLCSGDRPTVSRTVRPTVRAMLDALRDTPAYVLNRLGDVLAWNEPFDRLARPIGLLNGSRPNLTWFVLTDERAREHYPHWSALADQQVAELHLLRRGDPAIDAFAERLARTVGAPFTDRWRRRPVTAARTNPLTVRHPAVGLLRFDVETMELAEIDPQRLVVQLPADAATATALDELAGRRPGQLRAVAG